MTTEKTLTVPPDEIASMRAIISRDKLKVRAGGQGLIDKVKLTFRVAPCIQMWSRAKRRYMILSFDGGWAFDSSEARDSVLARLLGETDSQGASK